jgi:hypothetical protein
VDPEVAGSKPVTHPMPWPTNPHSCYVDLLTSRRVQATVTTLAFGESVTYGFVGGESQGSTYGAIDQRLLRLHGWLERSGWIYGIWKGAGSSILAFEFF